MIYEITFDSNRLLGFRVIGVFNRPSMSRFLNRIRESFHRPGKFNVYLDTVYCSGTEYRVPLMLLLFSIRYIPLLLFQVDRVAVVTNHPIQNQFVSMVDTIVPGVQSRTFPKNDKSGALHWLNHGIEDDENPHT